MSSTDRKEDVVCLKKHTHTHAHDRYTHKKEKKELNKVTENITNNTQKKDEASAHRRERETI